MSSYGGYEAPRDERSPWIWVAVGCGGLALLSLCVVPPLAWLAFSDGELLPDHDENPPPTAPVPPGPAPTDPTGPGTDPAPRHVSTRVEHVSGLAGITVGDACDFDVTRHARDDGTFWCNAQVQCGGRLLYGGPTAGFFECTLYEQPQRHVVGEDPMTTAQDRDAALRLDTLRSQLEVRDDSSGANGAFTLRARVSSVR